MRKALLAGLGVFFFTREKVEEVVKDLIQGGQLTREQGARLLDELVKRGEEGTDDLSGRISEDLAGMLTRVSPASRKELEDVRARLEAVERRLDMATAAPAAPDAPPGHDPLAE